MFLMRVYSNATKLEGTPMGSNNWLLRAFACLGIVGVIPRTIVTYHSKDDEVLVASYSKRAIAVGHWQIKFFDGFCSKCRFSQVGSLS